MEDTNPGLQCFFCLTPGVAMSQVVKIILAATFVACLHRASFAQLTVAPTPLSISDHLPTVQTPAYATFGTPQCDSNGTIYMRHESADNSSWDLAKIASDGSAEQTALAPVPGFSDMHTFAMATSDGGAVHEIVRAWGDNDNANGPSIYYLQFEPDGTFRSREAFAHEFIPAMLLPLPSGDFFAAGVQVKKQPGIEDTEEVPVAGIFDSDARLRNKLQSASPKTRGLAAANSDGDSETEEALQQGGLAQLGDDGDIYVLLSSSTTRVRVYSQSGEFRRELKLQQPFQEGLATGLWISSGRVLVTYEGEADNPRDAITYILYDARTGELIRAYRPQYTGTVACFQDGQSLTVLVNQKYSGTLAIGTTQLQ